jgi:uncharacterized protein
MDVLWIVLGSIALLIGLAGCFLPVLPGPPLAWGGLLILQLTEKSPFTAQQLLIWALVVVIVTVLDYVVPIYGTKKFGGTKAGTWGSTIGLIAGLFIGPLGIIVGPFVGALVGELIAGNKSEKAFKAAIGSFIGFLTGVVAKLAVVIGMIIHFITVLV